ncbi:hypothetical protein AOX55_00006541 (plasmid) [Sinorhizobium fredii CCBAU 25509]|nr:hypothetical protein AOX55_00006541 [Sinorhizobium fredii CCBAU 25509]
MISERKYCPLFANRQAESYELVMAGSGKGGLCLKVILYPSDRIREGVAVIQR